MKISNKCYLFSILVFLSLFFLDSCFIPAWAVFLGRWKHEVTNNQIDYTYIIEFKDSGSFEWIETQKPEDSEETSQTATGTYTYKTNAIYMTFSSDSFIYPNTTKTFIYEMSDFNKTMELGGVTYTKN